MPQQLDIIRDTALRTEFPERAQGAGTVLRQPCAARRGYSASSTVPQQPPDSRALAINRARIAAGQSHEDLCRRAGVSVRNWYRVLRGEQAPSDMLLAALRRGLGEIAAAKPPAVIKSYHRLVMRLLAAAQGLDPDAVVAADLSVQRPQVPAWLAAARVHNMAIYLTTVELEVENADFARALGISREAVRKARARVEDLREDPAIDALLTAITQQVRG